MMWNIQQAMQYDAIRTARIHPVFLQITGLKCSYGKISSPLTQTPVGKTEIPHSHMNTSYVWSAGSCEEAFSLPYISVLNYVTVLVYTDHS